MHALDYWLWLSLKNGLASNKQIALLEQFSSPEVIYKLSEKELKKAKLSKKLVRLLADKDMTEAELVKERCKEVGIRVLTLDSPNYPNRLKEISDPPAVLYVRSRERINLNDKICIGMVGNRDMTEYGSFAAMEIAQGLAEAGVVVVSGLARGIDGASHRGALSGGGITVAVLGCGVDIAYPPEHDMLMHEIIENGMVISEYPPGAPPLPKHFPLRNRIISGLCDGVVVVEAPKRSGSLITASYAIEQNRDVFAVPGNITKKHSLGCNRLIREGAILVHSASDILREYEILYINTLKQCINNSEGASGLEVVKEQDLTKTPQKAENNRKEQTWSMKDPKYQGLTEAQRRIISELSFRPVSLETLITKTALSADELSMNLMMLEIGGFIKTLPGKHFVLND